MNLRQSQKKFAKRKERERKKAAGKHHAELVERERRRRDQYPRVLIDPTNGDPEFVGLVKKANSDIDFDDPQLFQPGERQFYRLMRQYGFSYARKVLVEAMASRRAEGDEFSQVGEVLMLLGYGSKLVERIPEQARRRLMPYNHVQVAFRKQEITLKFSSMLSQRGAAGTIFYSRRKPTIEFNGKQWNVGFSRHAIERICERLNPRYIQYSASGDVHAFFSTCVYFEPVVLYGNQPAFALYNMCGCEPFVQYHTYVKQILGEENLDLSKGRPYYRVGYCPVVFEGEFAKAKTFLYPGYMATPEYGLILKSKLSRIEKDLLIQNATTQDAVVINNNPQTIKWFHDHGIPQVVHLKQDVFIY